jgi:hypothetical protein
VPNGAIGRNTTGHHAHEIGPQTVATAEPRDQSSQVRGRSKLAAGSATLLGLNGWQHAKLALPARLGMNVTVEVLSHVSCIGSAVVLRGEDLSSCRFACLCLDLCIFVLKCANFQFR